MTLPMVYRESFQSLLIVMRFNGQELTCGTGFVVGAPDCPVLITNRHNFTGRDNNTGELLHTMAAEPNEVLIYHNVQGSLGTWSGRLEPIYRDDKPLWFEHPHLGGQVDVVGLPLTNLDDVQLYPYDVFNPGPDIAVGPADPVSVVGFPFGVTAGGCCAIWATGFLASEPVINYKGLPVQLIDCRSRPGQSGSPVIAHRSGGWVRLRSGDEVVYKEPVSRLIGVYSGRINRESDIGIVWRISVVCELLSQLGIVRE
jgi:hypothetical protein